MRRFYQYTNDTVIEVITVGDGKSEQQIKTPVADAQSLVNDNKAVIYDTHDKMKASVEYAKQRRNAYPAIESQLDKMYHDGFDAWKETVKAVKDAHPKP